MSGYVDLHSHYIPGVDDGVRSFEEGIALLRNLKAIGYERVVATPHIRSGMFDNDRAGLTEAFSTFSARAKDVPDLPALGISSEHFFDDVFWGMHREGKTIPYPGNKGILVEFSRRRFPLELGSLLFELTASGTVPIIAHPERYQPLFKSSEQLEAFLGAGALAQLDLMSLNGHYGKKPKAAAERMLDEDQYFLACSDCHRPEDVSRVERAIGRLMQRVGETKAQKLLRGNPRRILHGDL